MVGGKCGGEVRVECGGGRLVGAGGLRAYMGGRRGRGCLDQRKLAVI